MSRTELWEQIWTHGFVRWFVVRPVWKSLMLIIRARRVKISVCFWSQREYDALRLPVLCRMSNLAELMLNNNALIEPRNKHDEVIASVSRLYQLCSHQAVCEDWRVFDVNAILPRRKPRLPRNARVKNSGVPRGLRQGGKLRWKETASDCKGSTS